MNGINHRKYNSKENTIAKKIQQLRRDFIEVSKWEYTADISGNIW